MQVLGTRVCRTNQSKGRARLVFKAVAWRPCQSPHQSELRTSARQIASYLLILTGTVLCSYVAGTYVWMFWEQHSLLRHWPGRNSAGNLTKLSIPKIDLEDVVLEGASSHSLLLGPAHLASTVEPGIQGNAVIAGHRDTFFHRIHSLRKGDDIYVFRAGERFHYVVKTREIVLPTDLWVIRPTADSQLTLITCYPTHVIGPAPKRLIVVAKLASGT